MTWKIKKKEAKEDLIMGDGAHEKKNGVLGGVKRKGLRTGVDVSVRKMTGGLV